MEFNFRALNIILKILKTEKNFASTSAYEREPEATDFRDSFSAKKDTDSASKEYYQVFSDKLGYIPNLSIVDLLCNLGPESATYLKILNKSYEKILYKCCFSDSIYFWFSQETSDKQNKDLETGIIKILQQPKFTELILKKLISS